MGHSQILESYSDLLRGNAVLLGEKTDSHTDFCLTTSPGFPFPCLLTGLVPLVAVPPPLEANLFCPALSSVPHPFPFLSCLHHVVALFLAGFPSATCDILC